MTEEQADEDPPLSPAVQEIGNHLDVGYLAGTIQEILTDSQRQLNENMRAIQRLIPYLSGMYYADQQRRYAERELFRLQVERTEIEACIRNALVMVPDLLYPVAVNAHT